MLLSSRALFLTRAGAPSEQPSRAAIILLLQHFPGLFLNTSLKEAELYWSWSWIARRWPLCKHLSFCVATKLLAAMMQEAGFTAVSLGTFTSDGGPEAGELTTARHGNASIIRPWTPC